MDMLASIVEGHAPNPDFTYGAARETLYASENFRLLPCLPLLLEPFLQGGIPLLGDGGSCAFLDRVVVLMNVQGGQSRQRRVLVLSGEHFQEEIQRRRQARHGDGEQDGFLKGTMPCLGPVRCEDVEGVGPAGLGQGKGRAPPG